jgi:hypothetical protein
MEKPCQLAGLFLYQLTFQKGAFASGGAFQIHLAGLATKFA